MEISKWQLGIRVCCHLVREHSRTPLGRCGKSQGVMGTPCPKRCWKRTQAPLGVSLVASVHWWKFFHLPGDLKLSGMTVRWRTSIKSRNMSSLYSREVCVHKNLSFWKHGCIPDCKKSSVHKLFCSSLMMYCCSVDQHQPWIGLYANASTSLHGNKHPGSCSVWRLCLLKNTRALQVAPEMLSTPEHHDKSCRSCVFGSHKRSILNCLWSERRKPAKEQNTEQIIGLWKPHQKAMLFFITWCCFT